MQAVDERDRGGARTTHRLHEPKPARERLAAKTLDHRSDRGECEEPEDDGADRYRGEKRERVLVAPVRAGENAERAEKIDSGVTARGGGDGGNAYRPRIEPRLHTVHIQA